MYAFIFFSVFFTCLFWKQIKRKLIGDNDMFKILKSHLDIIPCQAHPSSIFFMLSLTNFELAIKQWLGYILQKMNYNVCFIFCHLNFN
jgi:hypothetical protein